MYGHVLAGFVVVDVMHDDVEPAEVAVRGEEGGLFETRRVVLNRFPHGGAMIPQVVEEGFNVREGIGAKLVPLCSALDGSYLLQEVTDSQGTSRTKLIPGYCIRLSSALMTRGITVRSSCLIGLRSSD